MQGVDSYPPAWRLASSTCAPPCAATVRNERTHFLGCCGMGVGGMGSLLPLKAWGGVGLGRRHTGNGADCEQQAADTTGRELLYGIWHWHCANVAAYVPNARWRACQTRETARTAYTQSLAHMYGLRRDTRHIHTPHDIHNHSIILHDARGRERKYSLVKRETRDICSPVAVQTWVFSITRNRLRERASTGSTCCRRWPPRHRDR